jgi:nicotinamidase-related amidase
MIEKHFCLLTPRETVVALVDYQQDMFRAVRAPERLSVVNNAVTLAKAAELFEVPIIATMLGVKGFGGEVLSEIQAFTPHEELIQRTTMNPWEDAKFRSAVTNFGRQKIIIAGLWTEASVYFPAVDAIAEGYDVHVPTDACGDITAEAHERAIQRAIQAGVIPMTALQVMFEWQRDWARKETNDGCIEILRAHAANSVGARELETVRASVKTNRRRTPHINTRN